MKIIQKELELKMIEKARKDFLKRIKIHMEKTVFKPRKRVNTTKCQEEEKDTVKK